MTVASSTSTVSYAGDGATVAFSVPYYFLADGDLVVYVVVDSTSVPTIKTLTTHYTVTGAGNLAGGTVTMLTAPASGETIHIDRWVTPTQGVDYVENDDFPAETHEQALDRLTMLAQQAFTRTGGAAFYVGATQLMSLSATDLSAWDADSKRITNGADATAATDYVTLQQLQAAEVSGGNLPTVTGDDKFLVAASDAWAVETATQARTSLGLGTAAVVDTGTDAGDVPLNSDLGSASLVDTGVANGNVPVMDATGYPAADGSQITGLTGAQGASLVLIETVTASNTATIDFATGISSTYRTYLVVLSNVVPATDAVQLLMRFSDDAGSTWKSGASDYAWAVTGGDGTARNGTDTADTAISLSHATYTVGSDTSEGLSGVARIHNPAGTTTFQFAEGQTFCIQGAGTPLILSFGGAYLTAVAITGIQFLFSSGNVESGVFKLYGVK